MKLYGAPYPIYKHPRGLLHTQEGIDAVKSDILALLLTNPGERVMLPTFGTPLNKLMFEQNDTTIIQEAKQMIENSINTWEPRVVIQSLDVQIANDAETVKESLNPTDTGDDIAHILLISIKFSEFENISEINELKLEVPLRA